MVAKLRLASKRRSQARLGNERKIYGFLRQEPKALALHRRQARKRVNNFLTKGVSRVRL